jgi:hypothetical protein
MQNLMTSKKKLNMEIKPKCESFDILVGGHKLAVEVNHEFKERSGVQVSFISMPELDLKPLFEAIEKANELIKEKLYNK